MRTIDIAGKTKTISLSHGSGGRLMHNLINELFLKQFANDTLMALGDAALLHFEDSFDALAFSTDSFVVEPLFFPGGDIGKLAVCGTVNDLAVSGAIPIALSCGMIIEEGFSYKTLEHIVKSMADTAHDAGVKIVTGDTKVVPRGKCDKLFINTSGIGLVKTSHSQKQTSIIKTGDKVIVNGGIAEHGMAVMKVRENLPFYTEVLSDCAALNGLINALSLHRDGIKFMRDSTRGGVGTVLCEFADQEQAGVEIWESEIPVVDEVRGMCDLLGFDPLYVANEGKVVMIVDSEIADEVLRKMQKHPLGFRAAIIGEVTDDHPGRVVIETGIGGKRIVDMLTGDQLPRIC